jgi:hypothetical protein
VISTRDELGALWLPWCVDASDPSRGLHGCAQPARHPRAAQLRLTDLTNPIIQRALADQPYRDRWSWAKIESIAAGYRAQTASLETIIVDDDDDPDSHQQPAFMTFDGVRMLCEGCDRTSALWVSRASDFEVRIAAALERWPGYENPAIRERGRPFPGAIA